ncbi:MAG: hypothetical protein FWF53_09140 [Candidatus Azobacteroides sp.]|nr:hypothetical protein [Candidatus Azobacteroides sp.]
MKNYELYIENNLIELDDKFDFSLIFNSSVFQEITSVKSNRTTTIKIPKTIENLRAIEFSNIPENITEFPYQKKDVKLYKNGLPIIEEGRGYILAISDYIEFFITWGEGFDIKNLQNLKLRELQVDENERYVMWEYNDLSHTASGTLLSEENRKYGFAYADFVNTSVMNAKFLINHPFVSFKWIMEKVCEESEINIIIPDDENIQDLYNKLYIPVIEKNPDSLENGDQEVQFSFKVNEKFVIAPIGDPEISDPKGYIVGNSIVIKEDCLISFSGKVIYFFLVAFCKWVHFRIYRNGVLFYFKGYDHPTSNIDYELPLELDEESSIECEKDDVITFQLEVRNGGWPFGKTTWNPVAKTVNGYFTLNVKPKEVKPGSKYPIIPNLPDITAFDMLNTVMAMFGLFADYTPNGIRLYSIDEIYAKKLQAKDWTHKVITGNKIDSVSFSFGDFAQMNRLRYLKDETVVTDADYYFNVDNEALDAEKTLYEMKFAASDDSVSNGLYDLLPEDMHLAYFPIYTPEGFDNNGDIVKDENGHPIFNYEKISNRICKMEFMKVNVSERKDGVATFYDMSFIVLIETYYHYYQKIIRHPKVIEVTLLLTDLDIFTLDLMTPVYLEQTGNYYIIIDLQINGNNIAKTKLLQM